MKMVPDDATTVIDIWLLYVRCLVNASLMLLEWLVRSRQNGYGIWFWFSAIKWTVSFLTVVKLTNEECMNWIISLPLLWWWRDRHTNTQLCSLTEWLNGWTTMPLGTHLGSIAMQLFAQEIRDLMKKPTTDFSFRSRQRTKTTVWVSCATRKDINGRESDSDDCQCKGYPRNWESSKKGNKTQS